MADARETIPAGGEQVVGVAQDPRTWPWKPNPGGPRTLDEALQRARARGIQIEDDIRFVVVPDNSPLVPPNAFASYGGFQSYQTVRWSNFYVQERIPVKVKVSVLESDEAIVAVVAHEMYELNELRRLFEEREMMSGPYLHELIRVGLPKNLHDRAWDAADEFVFTMRKERYAND